MTLSRSVNKVSMSTVELSELACCKTRLRKVPKFDLKVELRLLTWSSRDIFCKFQGQPGKLDMKRGKLSQDYVDSDSDYEANIQENEDNSKELSKTSLIKSKTTTSATSNDAGEATFEISGKRRVTVRKFRSNILIDIREYYEDKASGEDRPGKKGISLTKEQYEKLKELLPEIDEAVKKMK